MQSPFPGMDPYLEPYWQDVHQRLVTYSCDQLQAQLPGDLYAHLQERVYLATDTGAGRSMYPDLRVSETGGGTATAVAVEAEVAEPLVVEAPEESPIESFVEIRDAVAGNRVVTVIEFQSPTNKRPGPGRDLYVKKQEELKRGKVSLVEIDLVREGSCSVMAPKDWLPRPAANSHYRACTWRSWKPGQYEYYPLALRARLPIIRIPLRETDADVKLNLQALLDQAYQNGRYATLLNYRAELEPPLEEEDAAWLHDLLREKGMRA